MPRRDALAFWIRLAIAGRAAEEIDAEEIQPGENEAQAMTTLTLLKMLLDDFVRYRWRDLVALALIGGGITILLHSQDPGARDQAKAIIGAGLIMLDPRGLLPGQPAGGTNGHANGAPPAAPTSAQAPAPSGTPAGWGKP